MISDMNRLQNLSKQIGFIVNLNIVARLLVVVANISLYCCCIVKPLNKPINNKQYLWCFYCFKFTGKS